jgi:hypothetical protein
MGVAPYNVLAQIDQLATHLYRVLRVIDYSPGGLIGRRAFFRF